MGDLQKIVCFCEGLPLPPHTRKIASSLPYTRKIASFLAMTFAPLLAMTFAPLLAMTFATKKTVCLCEAIRENFIVSRRLPLPKQTAL